MNPIQERIARDIKTHGFSVIVTPDSDGTLYGYTIGLSHKGLPELCVKGLDTVIIHGILSEAVPYAGQFSIEEVTTSDDIAEGYSSQIMPLVLANETIPYEHGLTRTVCWRAFTQAVVACPEDMTLNVLQIVFPTRDHSFDDPKFIRLQSFVYNY